MSLGCSSPMICNIHVVLFTEIQVSLRDVYYLSTVRRCSEEKENIP